MTLSTILRAMLVRWYLTVPGLMLSLALAGLVFSLVPWQYQSTGVAVLVPTRQNGAPSGADGDRTNPLMSFENSLSTTSMIMVQQLSTPEAQDALVSSPTDTFKAKNAADSSTPSVGSSTVQPFIYITAKSFSASEAPALVERVLSTAGQQLAAQQKAMRVRPLSLIRLQPVVGPTEAKPVLIIPFAATGAALLLGILLTCALAVALHRASLRAARRAETREARETKLDQYADSAHSPWPTPTPITNLATMPLRIDPEARTRRDFPAQRTTG
ncbi:MAG TPA: hypothetical protein VFE65_19195 [Pseudonocardia sp.]|jgi:hypothetical protein|nr:hypothetical protein [Pseudonocardia sp.]